MQGSTTSCIRRGGQGRAWEGFHYCSVLIYVSVWVLEAAPPTNKHAMGAMQCRGPCGFGQLVSAERHDVASSLGVSKIAEG